MIKTINKEDMVKVTGGVKAMLVKTSNEKTSAIILSELCKARECGVGPFINATFQQIHIDGEWPEDGILVYNYGEMDDFISDPNNTKIFQLLRGLENAYRGDFFSAIRFVNANQQPVS